jgi:membrane protease YdiL (CAAX protease family)
MAPPAPSSFRLSIKALGLGLSVLLLQGIVVGSLEMSGTLASVPVWVLPAIGHTVMWFTSLVLCWLLWRGDRKGCGLQKPKQPLSPAVLLWSIVLGATSGVLHVLLPGAEGSAASGFTLWQIVLFIWLYASFSEELLTRGLMQAYLAPLAERVITIFRWRIGLPVVVAALFFAAMHLALLTTGMSPAKVGNIVIFATVLGLIAGCERERTGSLWPAVTVHALFNVGGTIVDQLV